ncbi:MAG: hypothetical protein MJ220_00630 [Bacilli bacterium]|nr:hypothetical protein [Bacilli bacterium]
MSRNVRYRFSWFVLIEVLFLLLVLGGCTFLMVWNIVQVATADAVEPLRLVLTVVGFSFGWVLLVAFFPFLFWIVPILIGRRAAKAEDPREIPSDVKSSLLHRVGDNVVIETPIEVEGILIEAGSKVMVVGLGSNYYEIMHKNKRVSIPASLIDKSL